jgi:hypothetical protein
MYLEERPANEYNIVFLDLGNMAHIDKTDIRRMVPDYNILELKHNTNTWH